MAVDIYADIWDRVFLGLRCFGFHLLDCRHVAGEYAGMRTCTDKRLVPVAGKQQSEFCELQSRLLLLSRRFVVVCSGILGQFQKPKKLLCSILIVRPPDKEGRILTGFHVGSLCRASDTMDQRATGCSVGSGLRTLDPTGASRSKASRSEALCFCAQASDARPPRQT